MLESTQKTIQLQPLPTSYREPVQLDLFGPVELPALPSTPGREFRAKQMAFEQNLATLPQAEWETVHYFAPGLYGRVMSIAAGNVVVGMVHRHEHLVAVLSGRLTLYTADGPRVVSAGSVFKSPAGTKRVALVHEDCRWLTVHATDLTDLNAIEAEMICTDPLEWDDLAEHTSPIAPEDFSNMDVQL